MRRAWRWVRRKHEPISEGIETAGRGWARTARTAARVGRSLRKMGVVIERNGKGLARGRGRARQVGRSLVGFGAGLSGFGDWLTRTGRNWAPIGETVEEIGEHIGELDISPLPPEEELPPEKAFPPEEAPRPLPEPEPAPALRPPGSPAKKAPKRVPARGNTRLPDRAGKTAPRRRRPKVTPRAAPRSDARSDTGEPLPPEVREAIATLGKRPRSERLRDVIEGVCRAREWTTVKELHQFLGVSEKTLRSRHLPAMAKDGRLIRRFPNRRRHREQAYGVPSASSQT